MTIKTSIEKIASYSYSDPSTPYVWTDVANCYADNGLCSYYDFKSDDTLDFQSRYFTTFNFSIPKNAIILGIEITIKYAQSDAYFSERQIRLESDDVPIFYVTTTLPSHDPTNCSTATEEVYGGATETWSKSWTWHDMNSLKVRWQFTMKGVGTNIVYVDYVKVKIYYSIKTVEEEVNSILDTNWNAGNYTKPTIFYSKDGEQKPTIDYVKIIPYKRREHSREVEDGREIYYSLPIIINIPDNSNREAFYDEFLRCYDEENASSSRKYFYIKVVPRIQEGIAFNQIAVELLIRGFVSKIHI